MPVLIEWVDVRRVLFRTRGQREMVDEACAAAWIRRGWARRVEPLPERPEAVTPAAAPPATRTRAVKSARKG